MNSGLPMTVVMTPTGSPEVPMTLEIISEHTRSSAPSTADAGILTSPHHP